MIGSRLQLRRVTKTVSVVVRSYSGGAYSDTTVYSQLEASYGQISSSDYADDWGKSTEILDTFLFYPMSSGSLPVIEPKHFITDEDSNRYEVLSVINLGGMGERLSVTCRRYTTPGD